MKNLIQRISKGAGKGIAPLLIVGLIGCVNSEATKTAQYLPLCEGDNVKYDNLEVLAQARDGQRLVRADGKFYVGDEECFVDYSNSNDNVSYSVEGNRKILTITNKNGNVFKNIWQNDGSFYKEVQIK